MRVTKMMANTGCIIILVCLHIHHGKYRCSRIDASYNDIGVFGNEWMVNLYKFDKYKIQ